MNNKTTKILPLVLLLSFIFLCFSFTASAEVLFGEGYQKTLHEHLASAEKSIIVAMYFIHFSSETPDHPIGQLVDDLIDAKQRGVEVKVILEGSKHNMSRRAFRKLRDNEVKVYYDTPEHVLHVKGVVIDNRYIFVGSANWSRSAIEKNYEATHFADSPQDAEALAKYINEIPVQEEALLPGTSGVSLSTDFLLTPSLGRKLLKNQGDMQLDLYLLLCKIQQETGEAHITIDYDSLAKRMGYTELDDLGRYRSQHRYFWERINYLLTTLNRNGLIEYKEGIVTLKNNAPEKPAIIIPLEFWDYGYDDSLSMVAQYMYLICLLEASKSTMYPTWFRSHKDMIKLYGISENSIIRGSSELEEKRIIEVDRDMATPPDYSDRKANRYRNLPLLKIKDGE